MQVGIGFDVHPLVPGRQLVLGGVKIPFDKGLEGWSDADALTHAIIDALFGAAALGDIGRHFPPDDPQYKGISSLLLLKATKDKLARDGWQINNIDATILAEQPKLLDYLEEMRHTLGRTLGLDHSKVNIKAGRTEKLGFIGRVEGIAALAVALLEASS
ncbi:MAG: 2-C-methyl-D-erythritol 2,4-cyclodiphosphate synthase [Chloroflexota bacterium]